MKIGDALNDGIIFYINLDGKSGLMAMKKDLVYLIDGSGWGYDGYNWGDAISACNALGNGWHLPNKEELGKLYRQKNIVGSFAVTYYWSSTKYDILGAWCQYFGDGGKYNNDKNITLRVRAIKNFNFIEEKI